MGNYICCVCLVLAYALAWFGGMGITAGAHRLWCHRSYKAKWPLRLILAIANTASFQNSIYDWVRDHRYLLDAIFPYNIVRNINSIIYRVHHKFTDTNADPHNATRGFFFSHMGWLMVKKHPDVKLKGKTIDMTDLKQDPIVMFQKRYPPMI